MKSQFVKIASISPIQVAPSYDYEVEAEHRIIARTIGCKTAFYTSNCSHPDIFDFIRAKRQDGRLRNFNLSILNTYRFIDAVKSDSPWHLVWKKEIDRKIRAVDLWDEIMESTYNHAEPGFLMLDRINQFNNLWFNEYLATTNPSMPAGTLVYTKTGISPIEKLEGQSFQVRSLDGQWAAAQCFFSGTDRPLLQIQFDGRRKIKSTPEHKWPVLNQETGKIERVLASDLKVGDLVPANLPLPLGLTGHPELTRDDGFVLGVVLGQAYTTLSNEYVVFDAGLDQSILTKLQTLLVLTGLSASCASVNTVLTKFDLSLSSISLTSRPRVPDILYQSNDQCLAGFLDGLISTAFVLGKKGLKYKSRDKQKVVQIAEILGFHAIKAKLRHRSLLPAKTTLIVKSDYDLEVLLACTQLSNTTLRAKILDRIKEHRRSPLDKYNQIKKIKQAKSADVWDIRVFHDQHVFPIAWGFTGNCGEQPLPPYGACLLGSLMLHKFVRHPFADRAYFDFDKYREIVAVFTRMLDNVVDLANLPLPQQNQSINWTRRHGMGYMGVGSALTMLRTRYGSSASLAFVEQISKELAFTGFEAGVELAKEKGMAPVLAHTFTDLDLIDSQAQRCFNQHWAQRKSQRKKSVKGVELFLQSHYFDLWRDDPRGSRILSDLKKHGSRFSHHSSLAPTGCCLSTTRILSEQGAVAYRDILESNGIDWKSVESTNVQHWFDLAPFQVYSMNGELAESKRIFYNGYADTLVIDFEDHHTLTCTLNHKLLVLNSAQRFQWVEAQFLIPEDQVWAWIDNAPALRTVTSVEEGKLLPTWDIEVKGPECYLLENGVLSHNTIAASFGENCCLAKGTPVETERGSLPIEEVGLADKVLSFNPVTGSFSYLPLKFAGLTRACAYVYHIETTGGQSVTATADHRFLTCSSEQIQHENLKYETLLDLVLNGYAETWLVCYDALTNTAHPVKVERIKFVKHRCDTYDLEVDTRDEGQRNFVANGVVVHNSNGVEPDFGHSFLRNILVPGHASKEAMEVHSYSFHEYLKINKDADPNNLPDYFAVADQISPEEHVDVQAQAQRWIDSSISKTINIPTDYPFDKFKSIYMYGCDKGLKGCTTFRFNPNFSSGVLVKKSDLKNTTYRFNTADGQSIEVTGDQMVEYRGQQHMASNLADAIKNNSLKDD